MSDFRMLHTPQGENLLAKVHAGAVMQLTRVVLGNGIWTEAELASRDLASLKSECMSLAITDVAQSGDEAVVTAMLDNAALESGFSCTEMGIYARPEGGEELLYMAGYLEPAKSSFVHSKNGTPMLIPVTVTIVVAGSGEVEIAFKSDYFYVTKAELARHATDSQTHADIRSSLKEHVEDDGDPHGTLPAGGTAGDVPIKQEDGSLAWGEIEGTFTSRIVLTTSGVWVAPISGWYRVTVVGGGGGGGKGGSRIVGGLGGTQGGTSAFDTITAIGGSGGGGGAAAAVTSYGGGGGGSGGPGTVTRSYIFLQAATSVNVVIGAGGIGSSSSSSNGQGGAGTGPNAGRATSGVGWQGGQGAQGGVNGCYGVYGAAGGHGANGTSNGTGYGGSGGGGGGSDYNSSNVDHGLGGLGIDGSSAGDDAEDTTLIGGNGGNGGPGAVIIEYKGVE